jgi:hypothetical protein
MPRATPRAYQLRGLLFCGICQRRMQGNFNHGLPHYRCRFPNEYALANRIQHPRAVYLREDQVVPHLDRWLATTFAPDRVDSTLDALVDAQPDDDAETIAHHRIIAECDRKLASYRATLDAGGDPKIVSDWITQTQAEKTLAEARLRQHGKSPKRLGRDQIRYIVTTLADITQVIHDADPRDKAEIYSQLGLRLTYHPGQAAVLAEARPGPVCVRPVSEAQHRGSGHTDRVEGYPRRCVVRPFSTGGASPA